MEEQEAALVGWIVDVQRDFMEPEGRLYVRDLNDHSDPGAVTAAPRIERTVAWLRNHADLLVYTGDWHGLEDPEIDLLAPDPVRGTYPPHCMGRSTDPEERAGAEFIEAIRPRDPVVLDVDATPADAATVAATAVRSGRPIFIRKTRFDVFAGNPATGSLLAAVAAELGRPLRFLVAGVARDVCVTQAVDGLQLRGLPVTVVQDATWGLGLESEEDTLARWNSRGGLLVDVESLEREGLPTASSPQGAAGSGSAG